MEDWNAVEKQRVIDEYLAKHRVYCKDCDNYNDGHCDITHMSKHEYGYCDSGTRRIEHIVERSDDFTGTVDDPADNSSMADQPLICSHPCLETCRYHPINAPIDGTECRYEDLYMSKGCELWK